MTSPQRCGNCRRLYAMALAASGWSTRCLRVADDFARGRVELRSGAYGVVHIDAFSIWWWVVEGMSTPAWNVARFAVLLADISIGAFQSR